MLLVVAMKPTLVVAEVAVQASSTGNDIAALLFLLFPRGECSVITP